MAKSYLDVASLHAALDAERRARDLSWRQLAQEVGISPSTMSRLANGDRPHIDAFAALVQWLGVPPDRFMTDDDDEVDRPQPDLMTELAPLLRARKDLTGRDIAYLEDLIRAAIRHIGKAER
jgi:transcriptional regulator with XRE-family HTH domain